MSYKDKNKRKEHSKKYYERNKKKTKEKRKEYYEKNKNKLREKMKEYREQNKDRIREKKKKYREKYKKKIIEHQKEYYEKNKEKIREKIKKYREKNKDKIKKYQKEWREKNKYKTNEERKRDSNLAIKILLNYYQIKDKICFIDKNIYKRKQNATKKEINDGNIIVIDHKNEKESGEKDNYKNISLYKKIINSSNIRLDNYQLLCEKHNLAKHEFYLFYTKLKEQNSKYAEKMYEMYNKLFIYDKEKLKNELIKEGKAYLIKDDKHEK